MELDRFSRIVASYGAREARWPEAERSAARELLEASPEARRLLREAARTDDMLDAFVVAADPPQLARLRARIRHAPGPSRLDRLLDWLMPGPGSSAKRIWRPVAAACMPLLLGLGIGFLSGGENGDELTVLEELQLLAITEEETRFDE